MALGGGVIEWGVHEGLLSGISSYLNALLAMYRKLKVNALTIRYRFLAFESLCPPSVVSMSLWPFAFVFLLSSYPFASVPRAHLYSRAPVPPCPRAPVPPCPRAPVPPCPRASVIIVIIEFLISLKSPKPHINSQHGHYFGKLVM